MSIANKVSHIVRADPVTEDYSPGKNVPWWVKMGSKLVLARLPVPYAVWRSLGIFKHGRSDPQWSRERTFATDSLQKAKAILGRFPRAVLELGPGDSFAGALVSAAHGVERIYIVDVGDFATVDVEMYRSLVESLNEVSKGFSSRVNLTSRAEMLKSINATYHTGGLKDLAEIPEATIELSYSLKVLEHVRRDDFRRLIGLIAKASATPSLGRHIVDLHDHLGCRLNNLRFSPRFWEHKIVSNSGFYTNRLRFSEITGIAQDAGLSVTIPQALVWPQSPTDRTNMHPMFKGFGDDHLKVCMFDMEIRK